MTSALIGKRALSGHSYFRRTEWEAKSHLMSAHGTKRTTSRLGQTSAIDQKRTRLAPGLLRVLLDWRQCGVELVVILHHEIDIGREFHGLGGRF
jgi:hypothetical protein